MTKLDTAEAAALTAARHVVKAYHAAQKYELQAAMRVLEDKLDALDEELTR